MRITELATHKSLRYNLLDSELESAMDSVVKHFEHDRQRWPDKVVGKQTITLTKTDGSSRGIQNVETVDTFLYSLTIAFDPGIEVYANMLECEVRGIDEILEIGLSQGSFSTVKIAGLEMFTEP